MVKNFKNELVVEIPSDIKITIDDNKQMTIKGPKGTVNKDLSHIRTVNIEVAEDKVYLKAYFARTATIAKMGTVQSIIQNAILGVQNLYTYKMKIAYSHFPITLQPPRSRKGNDEIQILNFLGERSPRITYTAGPDIEIKADKEDVVLTGPDKEAIGQTAANIQKKCRIRKKDRRRFQDGIFVYAKYCGDDLLWRIKT